LSRGGHLWCPGLVWQCITVLRLMGAHTLAGSGSHCELNGQKREQRPCAVVVRQSRAALRLHLHSQPIPQQSQADCHLRYQSSATYCWSKLILTLKQEPSWTTYWSPYNMAGLTRSGICPYRILFLVKTLQILFCRVNV